MYKILRDNSRKQGAVWAETDANFLAVLNALIKLAVPELTLKGYAENGSEPVAPAVNDCYMVLETGTVWELSVEKYDIITWGGSAWAVEPYKVTELNAAFQAFWFEGENINIIAPYGMVSSNVQDAIEELAAAVFGNPPASGSGSGSSSGV